MMIAGSFGRRVEGAERVLHARPCGWRDPGRHHPSPSTQKTVVSSGSLSLKQGQLGGAGKIRDHDLRAGILQPVFQRFLAEQREQRDRYRAELQSGDVGIGGFRALRQQNADAVAGQDAAARQKVGELVGKAAQVRIAVAWPCRRLRRQRPALRGPAPGPPSRRRWQRRC